MTIITKIPGVTFTDATLPKLYRDAIIGSNTLFCYDFLDTYTWPLQADAPVGSVIKSLTPTASDASVVSGPFPFTRGFVLNKPEGPQSLRLPDTAKLPDSNTGFLMTVWFKAIDASTLARVYGWHNNYTGPFALVADPTSGVNKYNILTAGNVFFQVTLSPNVLHQLTHALVYNAGQYYAKAFLDGVEIATSGPLASVSMQPGVISGNNASIGHEVQSYVPAAWSGTVYRSWMDLTPQMAPAAATALIAKDYAANVGRFS